MYISRSSQSFAILFSSLFMGIDSLRERIRGWWLGLVREQKISVLVLCFFTFVTSILSVLHLRSQIFAPFMVSKSVLVKSDAVFARLKADEKREAELRVKDTDRDGLTDYAELNIYRTSPYLSDTDSDNIPDSVEIAQGANPLCPEGKNCTGADASALLQSSTSSRLTDLLGTQNVPRAPSEVRTVGTSSTTGIQSFVDQPPLPNTMTPADIRTYLVTHGLVTAQQINGLPDEMVIQVYAAAYQEALRVQSVSRRSSSSSSSSTSTN